MERRGGLQPGRGENAPSPRRSQPLRAGKGAPPLSAPKPLAQDKLATLSATFRLVGDPSRLRILLHCLSGPKAVNQIAEDLELSQSLVSHHLRLLREARLVTG